MLLCCCVQAAKDPLGCKCSFLFLTMLGSVAAQRHEQPAYPFFLLLLCAEEQRRQAEEQAKRVSEGMMKKFEHDTGGVVCGNC